MPSSPRPLLSRTLPAALAIGALAAALLGAEPAAATTRRIDVPTATPAWATASADRGTAADGTRVTAEIALDLPDEAAATSFATAVSTPGDPQYGRGLAPADWIARFAPTQDAVDAVTASATDAGLTVAAVPASRLFVVVSGTAARMDAYFATHLHTYAVGGDARTAADGPVSLPADAAGHVAAVGFDHPVATSRISRPAAAGGATRTTCSSWWGQHRVRVPEAYGSRSAATPICGYSASQVRALYGLSGSSLDGAGQTVAVIDAYGSSTARADLATWSRRSGLPAADYTERVPARSSWDASCDPAGWASEQTLDLEAVHAVAPRARLVYVGATDCTAGMDVALSQVLDAGLASIVSNSWGSTALDTSVARGLTGEDVDASVLVNLHQHVQAAGEGIGLYFASGDAGDDAAQVGFRAVDFPASSPWVTAVGGTAAGLDRRGRHVFSTAWGESVAVSSHGRWASGLPGAFSGGAGGGTSSLFARPAYQAAAVAGAQRRVTDVSALAAPTTGFLVGQRVHGRYGTAVVGGTSLATPIVAAQVALAQQAAGRPLGFLNPALYRAAAALRDVTGAGPRRAVAAATTAGGAVLVTIDRDSSLRARRGYDAPTGLGELTLRGILALAR